jgi:hypothetical protein
MVANFHEMRFLHQDKRLELIASWRPRANEGPPVPRRRLHRRKQPGGQASSAPMTPSPSGSALPWRRRGRISAAELLASNASTPAASDMGVDSEPTTPLLGDERPGRAQGYAGVLWRIWVLCQSGRLSNDRVLPIAIADAHRLPSLDVTAHAGAVSLDMPEVGVAPKRTLSRPATAPPSRPATPAHGTCWPMAKGPTSARGCCVPVDFVQVAVDPRLRKCTDFICVVADIRGL